MLKWKLNKLFPPQLALVTEFHQSSNNPDKNIMEIARSGSRDWDPMLTICTRSICYSLLLPQDYKVALLPYKDLLSRLDNLQPPHSCCRYRCTDSPVCCWWWYGSINQNTLHLWMCVSVFFIPPCPSQGTWAICTLCEL